MKSQKKMAKPSQIEKLLTAVQKGNESTVRDLVESDTFDAYIKKDGVELLFNCPNPFIAELLISTGVDFNAVSDDSKTALNEAASRGYAQTMSVLVQSGATTWNDREDGKTFLKRLFANSVLRDRLSRLVAPQTFARCSSPVTP
jgi:ankyrin repeat protein